MLTDNLLQKHSIIHTLVEATKNEKLIVMSKFLRARISSPDSYVTLLGETSSGKSTLVNGLLKKEILCTSSAPTTGTVVEVAFDDEIRNTEFYAVNRDATKEKIDKDLFDSLSKQPDDDLARLQFVTQSPKGYKGIRLFDTPGYGSILEKHEEILSEFIPNSDVLVYVIGYKIGIQDNDFNFMRYMQELISDDTEIIIVVNRCPSSIQKNDKRLREITRYVEDLFHKNLPIFTVGGTEEVNGEVLPDATELWETVHKLVTSKERMQKLFNAFDSYLNDLLMETDTIVEKIKVANTISSSHRKMLLDLSTELRAKGMRFIEDEVKPVYDKLIFDAPQELIQVRNNIIKSVCDGIDNESGTRMEETIAFVNHHSLPMTTELYVNEYKRKLQLILEDLNKRVDDYLDGVLADYYKKIQIQFSSYTEMAVQESVMKIIGKAAGNGLRSYLSSYGGRGGAGAGVANAAKHFLKKVGDLFGKKFSREVYNNLAHMLKKIGGTSVKNLGHVVTVVIELLNVIYDYATWKSKLKSKVKSGMAKWYDETKDIVISDLRKSKEENCTEIVKILNEAATEFELEADSFVEYLPELIVLHDETHRKLEALRI